MTSPRMMSSCTLHHSCCGCAGTLGCPEADADAAATAAAAQIADSLVSNYQQLLHMGAFKAERRLKIAYIIPHHNITGGLKVLCLHMQLLRQRGHFLVAVHRMSEEPAAHTPVPLDSSSTSAGLSGPPRALPTWSGVEVDEEVVLSPQQHLAARYPTQTLDAIVCGMFQQVPELLVGLPGSSAAIIYYEQGHEFLFGDPLRTQHSSGYAAADRIFHMVLGLPVVLACVSEPVREVLVREFGRGRAVLVPNGVDVDVFKPAWDVPDPGHTGAAVPQSQEPPLGSRLQPCPARCVDGRQLPTDASGSSNGKEQRQQVLSCEGLVPSQEPWIAAGLPPPTRVVCQNEVLAEGCRPCLLLVGDPGLQLKGFDVAIRVLQLVVRGLQQQAQTKEHKQGQLGLPLLVTWVCQRMPGRQFIEGISAAGENLVLAIYVQPPQDLLPTLYRSHSALLFTSHYEAWGMPVLEALACGVAVVTTSCSGVLSFTTPGEDCLVAGPGDVEGLARNVLSVLLDPLLRTRLQQKGRATACKYSLATVASRLEELLYSSVAASAELQRLRTHPMCQATARRACVAAIQAAAKETPEASQPGSSAAAAAAMSG